MADARASYIRTAYHEGGFQNKTSDRGNYCDGKLIGTNRGVTPDTYRNFFGYCPTVAQMKALTDAQAQDIFVRGYWKPCAGDAIQNQSIAELIVDFAFNSGTGTAIMNVQQAINRVGGHVVVDGQMGPKTLGYINSLPQEALFNAIHDEREALLRYLAQKSPSTYGKWLSGWLVRLRSFFFRPTALPRR